MTVEQKQLVIDNHNLIYHMLYKYHLDEDEYYDLCAIGLCQAAITFNGDISKFSTYACICMNNELRKNWQLQQYQKRKGAEDDVSMDIKIPASENGDTYGDLFHSKDNVEDESLAIILIEKIPSLLTPIQLEYYTLMKAGYTPNEIIEIKGCSKQYIAIVKRAIINKIKKYWEG